MTVTSIPSNVRLGSRAVERPIGPGETAYCAYEECPFPARMVKFLARGKGWRVVANVYRDPEGSVVLQAEEADHRERSWDAVEHFHRECYRALDEPYGAPLMGQRRDRSMGGFR